MQQSLSVIQVECMCSRPSTRMQTSPLSCFPFALQEYRKMMDELSGEKSGLGALDGPRAPPGPGGPPQSPTGASPASQGYTPPPGISPSGPNNSAASPYAGRPPPPPVVLGPSRMGGGVPPPHMMPMNRIGPRGPWAGPGGPPPVGGDVHWGANPMRPPMGMMPMGGGYSKGNNSGDLCAL